MRNATEHYDADYYAWQRRLGEFGGRANLFKFAPYIGADDRVLEFGCGGGFLLARVACKERIGIEVNPVARKEAQDKGLTCYADPDPVPDGWADVIISNSALEHVERPLDTLRALHRALKPGGRIVFVVPHEFLRWRYEPGDINQHLYTWSPMALGNLFATAGYTIERVNVIRHYWPPYHYWIERTFGRALFDVICRLYSWTRVRFLPLRVVARK